ncbi:MAG: hypothetical protein IT181_16065, partial [Acidobacteria bacterium]|nr:hypothetical protein [Acidobacteriota bacterium]
MSGPSLARMLVILVAVMALAGAPAGAAPAEVPATASCAVAGLPGLASQFARALRESRTYRDWHGPRVAAADGVLAAGPAADFWRVARAILGPGGAALVAAADVTPFQAVGAPSRPGLPCDRGVRARDALAWSMSLGGYSAQEIADVLAGHLTRADLDDARAQLMAGQPRTAVVAFLEAQWREPQPLAARLTPPASGPWQTLESLEDDLLVLAARHGVAPDLVRAVIAAESAGNPRAVS